MYVTNNRDGRDNEIFLSSSGGEIRTYLLPSTAESAPVPPVPPVPSVPSGSQVPQGSQGLAGPLGSVGAMSPPFTPKLNPPELCRVGRGE